MREIIFRGKTLDKGEWVYGVPVIAKDIIADKDITVMVDNPNEIVPREGLPLFEQVDPETVGQYTGLKDRNGKKIFEGDILRFPYPSTQNIYSVMWSGGSFVRRDPDGYYLSLNALNCDEYEVIGNIHDNPELLEGDHNG